MNNRLGHTINTFTTDLEIGGWEYEVEVEYCTYKDEFPPGNVDTVVELQKVWVYNEHKEKIEFPFLVKIDELLIEMIKEQNDE